MTLATHYRGRGHQVASGVRHRALIRGPPPLGGGIGTTPTTFHSHRGRHIKQVFSRYDRTGGDEAAARPRFTGASAGTEKQGWVQVWRADNALSVNFVRVRAPLSPPIRPPPARPSGRAGARQRTSHDEAPRTVASVWGMVRCVSPRSRGITPPAPLGAPVLSGPVRCLCVDNVPLTD